MVTIQYYENKTLFLSQLVNQAPAVDENIRLKGRKAKVMRLDHINENLIHVHIELEKIVKKSLVANDAKKKKR